MKACLGACLAIGLNMAFIPQVQAKETLVWLLRELPPLTIFEGAQRNQGAVDRTLALLIQRLPQYDHVIQRVNRARAMQMLHEPGLRCDPTLLWSPERATFIAFSIPSVVTYSNGLIIRSADRPQFAPFMENGEVDLDALLQSGKLKVGRVAERSYGPFIDQILKHAPADMLAPHYGNDAVSSLMQMEQRGRLQALIGYLIEARYVARQQGMGADEFSFLAIKGVEKYQFNHVGCSDNADGQQAISRINPVLETLRRDMLPLFYASWLDNDSRDHYLEDAKSFFSDKTAAAIPSR
jgi:uncharacterized protein (TIGR02285 family)